MQYRAYYNSPIGTLVLAATKKGISSISFASNTITEIDIPIALRDAYKQLDEYFNKQRTVFDLPFDIEYTPFRNSVWLEIMKIPYGETLTYLQLAQKQGNEKAARAIGGACRANPLLIVVPCHRVVGTGNKATGYAGGLSRKQWLLTHEGE